jgi:DNA repair ATPase RecN
MDNDLMRRFTMNNDSRYNQVVKEVDRELQDENKDEDKMDILNTLKQTLDCFEPDMRNQQMLDRAEDVMDKIEALNRELTNAADLETNRKRGF